MRNIITAMCVLLILVCVSEVMAERCSGISPVVFCDDFDRYCVDPPANQAEEGDGDLPDPENESAFWGYWPRSDGVCSFDAPYLLWTKPDVHRDYASVKATQERGTEKLDPDALRLARHVHDMTTEIKNNPLNTDGYGAVNGSGEILLSTDPNYVDPDTIGTVLKGHTYIHNGNFDDGGTLRCGAYANFTYYTELNLDGDRAPTNFIWRNCYAETGDHGGSPHQLMLATDVNPDPGTTWHHASFAFGLVAHHDIDLNPCNVDAGRRPTAWRAFVYDGKDWLNLKAPDFGLPMPDHADFYPWMEWNLLRFFIGTDYIEVRLYNARAEEMHRSEGVCGYQGCNVKRCFGGINHWAADCRTEVACPPSQGTCLPGTCTNLGYCDPEEEVCVGGAFPNKLCTSDADCPDACERGLYDGDECDGDPDCAALGCWGGSNHRGACTGDGDCPAAPPTIPQPYFVARVPRAYKGPFNTIALGAGKGVDQTAPLCEQIRNGGPDVCVGGINNGNACASVADCPPSVGTCASGLCDGGTNDGGVCTRTCPDGVCSAQGQCDGGANAGQPCDCPAFEECLRAVSTWDMNMAVDDVILWDGVFVPKPGACCRIDTGTCEDDVPELDCTGDDIWHGNQICD
ncbi:MAG: hypothetical protein ACYTBZ_21765, partial [Planctomycetota bacterium]